jgi:hypothetical protein
MHFKEVTKSNKGKVKGTPNQFTQAMRDHIKNVLEKTEDVAIEDLLLLTPRDRWMVRLQLLEFVTPKLARLEAEVTQKKVPIINVMTFNGDPIKVIEEPIVEPKEIEEIPEAIEEVFEEPISEITPEPIEEPKEIIEPIKTITFKSNLSFKRKNNDGV